MTEKSLMNLLQRYSPFDQLPAEFLTRLEQHVQLKKCPAGAELFSVDDVDPDELYLIKGSVNLVAKDGRESTLNSRDEKAVYPLARLRPRMYTATASSDLIYFVISKAVVDLLQSKCDSLYVNEVKANAGPQGQALLYEFRQELNHNRFMLPSLPEVANKVRQCADDPACSLNELASLINADPAMAAKLLRTANSALYRGISPYKDTLSAISRLGLSTTKQLVTSYALLSVFNTESVSFKEHMQALWSQSLEVAAYCYVLAKQLPTLHEEEALLAGLLHLIGDQTILLYASRFYDLRKDQQQLDSVRMQLRGEIGSMVMEKWNFPAELTAVVREFDNWLRDSNEDFDYCDLVQVAVIYASQHNGSNPPLPNIQSIPAFQKLALTQQQTDEIIQEAQDQIDEIRSWFH